MTQHDVLELAPEELAEEIRRFFPESEWDNAAAIARLESGWDWRAVDDTRTTTSPCGAILRVVDGEEVAAEYSIGWFQINACSLPSDWVPEHLFNTRHNVGTAHMLWDQRGWWPWYFSARQLGLL